MKTEMMLIILMLLAAGACTAFGEDLLIIGPDEFMAELVPLKSFKDASGCPAALLSLSYVYGHYSGMDEAEQVKRCIAWYKTNRGIKYAMLVGDVDTFPVRWRWWGRIGEEYWGVSDLYYADLFKAGTSTFDDWDENGNGLYGEIEFQPDGTINNDNIDFLPDVAVGRIPASDVNEVAAYVEKIIRYETRTESTDMWFRTAALYTGCWDYWNNRKKDDIGANLAAMGFAVLDTNESQRLRYGYWYDCPTPTEPNKVCCDTPLDMPDMLLADMNNGAGFVNYLGHGAPTSWSCVGLGTNHLANLTNDFKLPVTFAGACDTGRFARMARFHPYKDVSGVGHCGTSNGEVLDPGAYPHAGLPKPACIQDGSVTCGGGMLYYFDENCIAESFVFGNPVGLTGAIAYLGERTGGRQWVRVLDEYFFEGYTGGGLTRLGDMWCYMIENYYIYYGLADANTWSLPASEWDKGHMFDEPQKLVLFGDPSLRVGGAFGNYLCGTVYDGQSGPLLSGEQYRIDCDVTVPAGQKLTVQAGASVAFWYGTDIRAVDSDPAKGVIVNGTASQPVNFVSVDSDPDSREGYHGVRIKGQMRIRNGGQIKLH